MMRAWMAFWFEADGRAQMRLFRALLCALLLICYAVRSLDLELFFGQDGIVTLDALPDLMELKYRFSIFNYFTSKAALWIWNGVFLASLLLLSIGVASRITAVVVLLLHVSFIHRNPAIAYGFDTVACFFLLFFCLADFRSDRDYRADDIQATLGSMAFRLSQVQLCVIYGYSGIKKLKGITWWSGEALWGSLAQVQLARWDFSWLAHFPLVLAVLTFATLAWEIYFPALIWSSRFRLPALLFGVCLHLGIGIALNLPFFAALMISTYSLFLSSIQISWILNRISILFPLVNLPKVPRPASE